MGKVIRKALIFLVLLGGTSLMACGGKKTADSDSVQAVDSVESQRRMAEASRLLQRNGEDIQALWEDEIGKEHAAVKYALAGDYIYLSSADGKEGMLLTFYQDRRNEDNFDGVAKKVNQRMALYGKSVVVSQNMGDSVKNTYYENTEHEGLNPVLVVMQKAGRQYYYNNAGGVIPDAEAKKILAHFRTSLVPIESMLKGWKELTGKCKSSINHKNPKRK